MEVVVNGLRQSAADAFDRGQVGDARPRYRFGRSEGLQQGLLARGSYAGDLVQRIGANRLGPPGPVRADGEAVRLVAQPLDVIEHRIALLRA